MFANRKLSLVSPKKLFDISFPGIMIVEERNLQLVMRGMLNELYVTDPDGTILNRQDRVSP